VGICWHPISFVRFSVSKCGSGNQTSILSPSSNRGFTLIETLVAISILAISLVVILQLFSGGLKSSKLSDEYTRGIFYAKEKMDEILLAEELTEGVINGKVDDDFRWRAEALHLDIEEAKDLKLPFRAFNINVDVIWDVGGRDKHFTISAIKLVKPRKDDL
jgi:general secretion pathway protein I